MIVIINVSEEYKDGGLQQYEVRINRDVICRFEHDKKVSSLAECLRDAARAVEILSINYNQKEQ